MNLLNEDLNYYFIQEVQMRREETKRVKQYVLPKVEKILRFVHNQDARMAGNPLGVGSSFQGLKTKHADEFDFNIILNGLGTFYWGKNEARYYNFNLDVDLNNMDTIPTNLKLVKTSVPLPSSPVGYTPVKTGSKQGAQPVWLNSNDLEFSGDIIPFLVKKRVKDLIQQAIRDLELRDKLRLGRKVHGPALTLRIPCEIGGIDEVSVDFAPTLALGMSFPSHVKWPRPNAKWPSRDKIAKVKEIGINFTAKKPFDWLYSFAVCEGELMNNIDIDGGCRKKAQRIIKRLREQYWSKGSSKAKLSSYHLKNIFLWECENHPYSSEWKPEKLSERVESMLRYLLKCIRERRISQYFYPDVNLLSVKDEDDKLALENERLKIAEFLEKPARFLRR